MISKKIFLLSLICLSALLPVYSQTANSVIEYYSSFCELKNTKLATTDTIIILINNQNGEAYTKVSIPYSKTTKIYDLSAWIEDAKGQLIRKLKNNEITSRNEISDISLYEDHFVKTFQLKHNTYPYKVCYSYTVYETQFFSISDWSPALFRNLSTRKAKLSVVIPKDCAIKKFERGINERKVDSLESSIKYEFYSHYDKIDCDETFSVPFDDIKPLVTIIPIRFKYGNEGNFADWRSYGNWFYNLNKDLDELPDFEKNTVRQLINGISDKKEIIKVLYHYMQDHIRYVNVTIGIGGMKSYPASYVSENKYGDCKALTNYMKSLLKFAGIQSYFTLLNSGSQPTEIIKELPYPQFNHVILTVPLGSDTIWLENTSNDEPFAYINTFIQNREALLVDENNSRFIKIPMLLKNNALTLRKADIQFYSGNADIKCNFLFKGQDFERFNELNSEYNKNEQDRIVRDYMPFENYEVLDWKINKIHRDTAQIELLSELNLYHFLKPIASEFYFSIFPSRIKNYEPAEERKTTMLLPYPIYNIDTFNYFIPGELEIKTTLEKSGISTKYGHYELSFNVTNNALQIIKKLELFPGTYSPEQYKGFYQFIKSVRDIEKKKIILRKKI